MKKFTLLHLSDLHMSKSNSFDIKKVLKALMFDLKEWKETNEENIDFVCFTGDLIHRGDLVTEQFQLACDNFIDPMLKLLGLKYEDFYIVPGNHEIDRNKVDFIQEEGLKNVLITRDAVNRFLDNVKEVYLTPILHFKEMLHRFQPMAEWEDLLSASYIRTNGEAKVGIASLNSAWRCTGHGDKSKLIVGERQVDRSLDAISECDFKIALIHHPTSWLNENDQRAVELRLGEFDLVLNGHLHDLSERRVITQGQSTLYCAAGSLFAGRERHNGYSIIRVDLETKEIRVDMREYYDDRGVFDKAVSRARDGRVIHMFNS